MYVDENFRITATMMDSMHFPLTVKNTIRDIDQMFRIFPQVSFESCY